VQFIEVNHRITSEDNFGFVKVSLIRRGNKIEGFNQRKLDYLTSLNPLEEKAIRSNFPLDMTKDMIAIIGVGTVKFLEMQRKFCPNLPKKLLCHKRIRK